MFNMKQSKCVPMVFVLITLLGDGLIQVGCLNFSYATFTDKTESDLIRSGQSRIALGALQVTLDVSNDSHILNLSGRFLHKKKFNLWSKTSNATSSFNSTFTLNITPKSDNGTGGEGMAFILTGDAEVPLNSEGQWLGIVNKTTNGSSQDHIVAIEFDTRRSYADDEEDNHVGVNVNSINSFMQYPLRNYGVNLSNGTDVNVSIQYDAKSKNMTIGFPPTNEAISLMLNLSEHLPEDVYVGFSASTGNLTELNCVKSWNFTGEDMEKDSNNLLWVWITITVTVVIIILLTSGFTCYFCWRRKIAKTRKTYEDQDMENRIGSSTTPPRKFRLKELKNATRNFHSMNKLGKGGFGTVYKGFLKEINMDVAIKRVSKDSHQGKQEFIAEVTTISHLEHKNLVKLIGWCYESGELLLVYKFMPNGSLDKLIYFNESQTMEEDILSWERRHNIICGVASALDYLHDGCEKRVIHRDVKASNVMLDSEFNARLGDFGLARTVEQKGKTHHTTNEIAGTPGYMAPECCLTGRASVETDVYGFGVFVMEVVCGRRPGTNIQDYQNGKNNIVDWVWYLYGKQRIVDAIDPRLHDVDEENLEGMLRLGLACCHPNPNQRPSMRVALQVLSGEIAPPIPPNEKPAFMWPVLIDDSEISINGGQFSPSTDLSGR